MLLQDCCVMFFFLRKALLSVFLLEVSLKWNWIIAPRSYLISRKSSWNKLFHKWFTNFCFWTSDPFLLRPFNKKTSFLSWKEQNSKWCFCYASLSLEMTKKTKNGSDFRWKAFLKLKLLLKMLSENQLWTSCS